MLAETSEIAEEENVFERNDTFIFLKNIHIIYINKYHMSSDFISLRGRQR